MTNGDDKVHHLGGRRPYTFGGGFHAPPGSESGHKSMKKLAVAVAAATLMGVGPAAEQAARTSGAQAPANAPKLSPSHSSAQPESTAARKPASSSATKSTAPSALSA